MAIEVKAPARTVQREYTETERDAGVQPDDDQLYTHVEVNDDRDVAINHKEVLEAIMAAGENFVEFLDAAYEGRESDPDAVRPTDNLVDALNKAYENEVNP